MNSLIQFKSSPQFVFSVPIDRKIKMTTQPLIGRENLGNLSRRHKHPLLVHLSRRLKCTIVIMCCPSSVCRPSSLTFHIFDFSSETAERNSTKLDRKQDLNVLFQVCVFWADRKNKMAALASDWLRHFRLLL